MTTKSPSPKGRKPRENQYIFEPGVRGRKTGLTLPDSGIRDEHGLEPMDDLFSSPEKSKTNRPAKTQKRNLDATLSSEEDMDTGQSTIPEPNAVLTARSRGSMRMPPPKSKSPIKTYLQSPPKRNPSLGPASSPTRGSVVIPKRVSTQTSVARRLDFSIDDQNRNPEKITSKSSPQKEQGPRKPITQSFGTKLTNGTQFSPVANFIASPDRAKQRSIMEPLNAEEDDESEDEDAFYPIRDDDPGEALDEPIYEEDMIRNITPEADLDSPLQVTRKKPKTGESKAPASKAPAPKSTAVKATASKPKVVTESTAKPLIKRKAPNQSNDQPAKTESKDANKENQDADVHENQRPAKRVRGRPKKAKSSQVEKVKRLSSKKGVKSSSPAKISSPAEVHRGPPRPRNNRGLYILRREMPNEVMHTKSGRTVVKPIAYWKNEAIVYGNDEDGDTSFLHPTIKEVIRLDHIETPSKRRPRRKGFSGGSRKPGPTREASPSESDSALAEPWETSPGRVYGAVRTWNPSDPIGEDSAEKDDEIAMSSAAIITRDIGATFQFAKTLTLPFFGSGMVDLPPGAFKKPKNTRRMQMVFFVFEGRVSVTVNENSFSIGKGGMWQVPRGNFYSIENDYHKLARIFFSQGCEILEESLEDYGPEGQDGQEGQEGRETS